MRQTRPMRPVLGVGSAGATVSGNGFAVLHFVSAVPVPEPVSYPPACALRDGPQSVRPACYGGKR